MMARNRRKHKAATSQPASDLEILFPDREVTIAGKTFMMRELRFAQQLQYQPLLQPINKQFDQIKLDEQPIEDSANNVLDILTLEYESVIQLMAICSGQSVQWIKSLPSSEGEELILFWWATNSRFFIRRQIRKAQLKMQMNLAVKTTGAESSTPLSKQDTTGDNSPVAIPSGK